MRPVSDRLLGVVQASHVSRSRITLVTGFPQTVTPTGTQLTVLAGDVRMDSSATVRGTLDCTVIAPWGSIKPSGAELFVEYGVEVEGGRTEWVSLGYFGVETVTQDGVNGPLRITGSDRMGRVNRTENAWNYVAPIGTSHQDLFHDLLYGQATDDAGWFDQYPGVFPPSVTAEALVFDYTASSTTIGYELPIDKEYGEILRKVAGDHDKRLYFDYKGRLNIVDEAVVATAETSVVTVSAGAGGTLTDFSRQVTLDGVYNAVRVEGEQPVEGDPPWGAAWNNTLYGIGRQQTFGNVTYRFSSPILTTAGACEAAAVTIRNKIKGLKYSAAFGMVPNPALEPLDVVTLRYPGPGPTGTLPSPSYPTAVEEIHVIDTLTFPLAGGSMAVTTRDGWMTG